MDKIMVTVLLVVAGIVCSIVVLNAVYPAITGSSGAIIEAANKIDDRIKSNIAVIEMTHEGSDAYIWIKNTGISRIDGINNSDIFFGEEGNFDRIPYGGSTAPYWEYIIENDDRWNQSATVKITVHSASAISGNYVFKIVIPNGLSDTKYYSTT
jgi:flagellar protein FlaG